MTGQHATLRILDANANRAAEGLRVVEEYLRFELEDATLAAQAKNLRHRLTETLHHPAIRDRARCRDAAGDVGAEITTASESQRDNGRAIALASLGRLTQALRCLEEYSKLLDTSLAADFERLRYLVYDFDSAVQNVVESQSRFVSAQLYVLVDAAEDEATFVRKARATIDGGADVLQLRDKAVGDRQLLERASLLRELTSERALMIVNDRADLALACGADGLHVGQEELPARTARRLIGPAMLLGVSTHDLGQLETAVADGASYVGCGPTFPSTTKDFDAFPGVEFAKQATESTALPCFAIGGVTLERLDELLEAGVRRVAVSAAVWQADDPAAAAAAFKHRLAEHAL